MKRLKAMLLLFGLLAIACNALTAPTEQSFVIEPSGNAGPSDEFQAPSEASDVPRITAQELKERLDNGEVILVADTRAKQSFDQSHIAGAISMPANEVESRLDELPRDQEIVFYCT